jgi:hypothetical protein
MSTPKLRPGYLEVEDIRSTLSEHAADGAELDALTAAFLAEGENVAAVEEANGVVAHAETFAQQRANDTLDHLVDAFLKRRGQR